MKIFKIAHSMQCEFPEGCSCGAFVHNAMVDEITASTPAASPTHEEDNRVYRSALLALRAKLAKSDSLYKILCKLHYGRMPDQLRIACNEYEAAPTPAATVSAEPQQADGLDHNSLDAWFAEQMAKGGTMVAIKGENVGWYCKETGESVYFARAQSAGATVPSAVSAEELIRNISNDYESDDVFNISTLQNHLAHLKSVKAATAP